MAIATTVHFRTRSTCQAKLPEVHAAFGWGLHSWQFSRKGSQERVTRRAGKFCSPAAVGVKMFGSFHPVNDRWNGGYPVYINVYIHIYTYWGRFSGYPICIEDNYSLHGFLRQTWWHLLVDVDPFCFLFNHHKPSNWPSRFHQLGSHELGRHGCLDVHHWLTWRNYILCVNYRSSRCDP